MPIGSTVIAAIKGDPGAGFPAGGATGQVLAKVSAADYDTVWTDVTAGSVAWADVTGKPTFATVATSGAYADLTGLPSLGSASSAAVADFATAAQGGLAASALQPGAIIPWANVSGKPALFDGAYSSLTGIPATFTPSTHTHAYADLTGVPATFAPSAHNQAWSTITATPTTIAGYGITDAATAAQGALASSASQPGHTHAQSDVTGLVTALAGKAATAHTHVVADVTGLQTALDGKQPLATVLTNTTAAFTASQEAKLAGIATGSTANATDAALRDRATHTGTQAIATVTGLQTALDGKQAAGAYAAASHTHAIADVTGLQGALDGKQAAGSYATAAQGALADTAVQPAALSAKQDALVSGTNIKTVNGNSLLGSGDLTISGGGGSSVSPIISWAI